MAGAVIVTRMSLDRTDTNILDIGLNALRRIIGHGFEFLFIHEKSISHLLKARIFIFNLVQR